MCLDAFKQLTYEINESLCLVHLLDEYLTHRLICEWKVKEKLRPILWWVRICGNVRNNLILEKASSHSLVHSNFSFFFRATKKRKALSSAQERKQDKVVRQSVICWTSLTLAGLLMLMMAWNLSRFASTALFVNMKLRNFPTCTLKKH